MVKVYFVNSAPGKRKIFKAKIRLTPSYPLISPSLSAASAPERVQ
jgi:hypothetical protein